MRDRLHTLSHLLATMPLPQDRWSFLGAHVLPDLDPAWRAALDCEQPQRGIFLELEAAGYSTRPVPDLVEGAREGALVLAGRSRALNEWRVAVAHHLVRAGGSIVVCGAKTDGIASLRRRCGPVLASFAKHHATAFTMKRREGIAIPSMVAMVGRWTIPRGTFSDDGPDPASQLLVRYLDRLRDGSVADLGAGWGYLTAHVRGPVDAYEADYNAVQAIRENCPEGRHMWHDVLREPLERRYDTVVMNPPFHSGRMTDPGLGRAFIETAAGALMPQGRLLMVANRKLPYEAVLKERFKRVEMLADEGGYKVLTGVR